MPNRPQHLQPVPDNATLHLSEKEQTDKWTIYKRRAAAVLVGGVALLATVKAVGAIMPDSAPATASKEQVVDALKSEPNSDMKTFTIPQGAGPLDVAEMVAPGSHGNPVVAEAIDQIVREKQGIPEDGFIQPGKITMPTAELDQDTFKMVDPQVNTQQ